MGWSLLGVTSMPGRWLPYSNRFDRPHTVRFDDGTTAKGYHRHYFEPVWARYIPSPTALLPETQQKQQASQRFKIRALSLPHAVTRRLVRDATDPACY